MLCDTVYSRAKLWLNNRIILLTCDPLDICFQTERIMCMTGWQGKEAPILVGTTFPCITRITVKVRLLKAYFFFPHSSHSSRDIDPRHATSLSPPGRRTFPRIRRPQGNLFTLVPSRRSLNGSEESLGSWQLVDAQGRLRPQERPVAHKCESLSIPTINKMYFTIYYILDKQIIHCMVQGPIPALIFFTKYVQTLNMWVLTKETKCCLVLLTSDSIHLKRMIYACLFWKCNWLSQRCPFYNICKIAYCMLL